jgi:hypothetical protein
VSSQTVYAVFRSKRGILAEILEQAKFGVAHEKLVNQALSSADPRERLILAAKIARQIYDSEKNEYALLKAAADMLEQDECRRAEAQKPTIELLAKSGQMKSGLKKKRSSRHYVDPDRQGHLSNVGHGARMVVRPLRKLARSDVT